MHTGAGLMAAGRGGRVPGRRWPGWPRSWRSAVVAAAGVALTRHSLSDVSAAAGGAPQPQVTSRRRDPGCQPGRSSRRRRGLPPGRRGGGGAAAAAGLGTRAGATRPGPDGARASWVVAENSRLGTTAWRIRHPKGHIAGFANRTYARQGQRMKLYVTTAAARFRAEAFRMGYYRGTGARLIWTVRGNRRKVPAAAAR